VIFDDLVAEQDRLESILDGLDDAAWVSPSGADGWSVADVVLHLAQTEEAVVASAGGGNLGLQSNDAESDGEDGGGGTLDDFMDRRVRAQRGEPAVVFDRWRTARRAAVRALREADPAARLPWAAAPLKPTTLATTRLAEHWAHGLDITGPLGIPFPDTDRLRHIAWLAHGSLPYAFTLVGEEPHDVFCELDAPDGSTWRYGSPETDSTITGSAGAFCRVGAQRLAPGESGLVASGPYGPAALRVLRNYAG
jgi:uncharacterized protein (TIGR03084 family)